jgi:hypothetical protein
MQTLTKLELIQLNFKLPIMKNRLIPVLFFLCVTKGFTQSSFFQFYFNSEDKVRHDALLSIDGNDINAWVKYFDDDLGQYVVVHQGCYAELLQNGVAILCDDPTYDGTNVKAYYHADNFFLVEDKYGRPILFNYDDNGSKSKVLGLKELRTRSELQQAYTKFVNY